MNVRNARRPGAWIALALLILSGILPAFASPGVWVCPDGRACPWMNRSPAAKSARPKDAGLCALTASAKPCCRCPIPAAPSNALETPARCRFIPALGPRTADRILARSPQATPAFISALRPASLDELPAALAGHGAVRLLPADDSLPSPQPPADSASRAPPSLVLS